MSKITECCRKATYHVACSLMLLVLTSMGAPAHATVTPPAPSCGEEPADIVLMLDRTGSVSTTNRNLERDAARDFIDAIAGLSNGSRIAIGRFGDGTDGGLEAEMRASLSTDYAALKTATTNALSSNSSVGTNLRDAINVAQKELDDHAIFDKRVIILLSDGDANEPGSSSNARAAAEAAAATAKGKGTIIITIAFDASGSTDEIFRDSLAVIATQPSDDDSSGAVSDAEKTAENTDGDYFLIGSGADLKDLFLNNIFETIRCDDHDPCTVDTCNEDNNKCEFKTIPECKSCDEDKDCTDGNACNGAEKCGDTGTCKAGTPPVCADDNACTANSCDPAKGCVSEEVNCDDHNPCTADGCDKVLGCQHTLVEGCKQCDGPEDCTNNNKCDGDEFCGDDGTCKSGTPPVCADADPCTVDSCNATAGCLHNAKDCDDNDECTADSCGDSGECQHDKVSCDDQDACTADSCDPEKGCGHADVSCDDHNPCTADSCDTVLGCQHTLIEGCKQCETVEDCTNHNKCDGDEFCGDDGTCKSGTPPECADTDACTGDSCDKDKGCVHNSISCEDSDACTAESCDAETGCGHESVSCEDSNACTVDSCDTNAGCQHEAVNCDDENPCTADSCDEVNGCQHTFVEGCQECESDEDCDNHNVCDGPEICGEGHTCQSGEGPNCDDEDECTVDSCDPESGCLHEDAGLCNPPPCPDADQDGVCDPDDNCVNTPNPNQEDDNHNGVGNACEQPGDDSGGAGGGGGPSIIQCLQGSGVSGKASDPRCSGFACSLNRSAVSVDGAVLGGWLLLSLGALTPWILLKRRVPVRARRSR